MYQYFTETGDSFQDALEKIKSKYGNAAQVLSHRTVSLGGFLGFFAKEGIEISGCLRHDSLASEKNKLEEEKRKIIAVAQAKTQNDERDRKEKDDALKSVLEEMKSLKEQLQKMPMETHTKVVIDHETLDHIENLLEMNEFTKAYTQMILGRVKKEFSLDALSDRNMIEKNVIAWIWDTVQVWSERPLGRPRVFILVGPTGVGKTTTIAKLAAVHVLGSGGMDKKRVSMITIDNYRIGAKVQIESYGEIMNIPSACVESFDALRDRIEHDSVSELILVDTIGKSPKDFMKLAEMRQLLAACGTNAEVHLAVSATTKTKDVREIFQQFEPFGYQSVVLTKLDETTVVGNFISLVWEKGKPISFITDGQSVPQDIQKASRKKIMENLTGFTPEFVKNVIAEEGKKG